ELAERFDHGGVVDRVPRSLTGGRERLETGDRGVGEAGFRGLVGGSRRAALRARAVGQVAPGPEVLDGLHARREGVEIEDVAVVLAAVAELAALVGVPRRPTHPLLRVVG